KKQSFGFFSLETLMVPCSNWLYLENKRYNRIDKRGAEINLYSTNKIDKIIINLKAGFRPNAVTARRAKQILYHLQPLSKIAPRNRNGSFIKPLNSTDPTLGL
ncbi:MAG: hypothetical protein Q7U16_12190, partial [Agitococcus sp.]|nr:hypothetical protein [Agitococcus sp.]